MTCGARGTIVPVFAVSSVRYELAWHDLQLLATCAHEKASNPEKLRSYIKVLIDVGERDPV